jgi:hypothetical protein
MVETKPVGLSLISTYGQGRMAAPKAVWLTLVSAYWQWFLHIDNEEWLRPNPYDYHWYETCYCCHTNRLYTDGRFICV